MRILSPTWFSRCMPPTLRQLNLDSIVLPLETQNTPVGIDSWHSLRSLALRNCHNIPPYLADFSSPELTSFVFQDSYLEEEPGFDREDRLITISTMLSRFSGLQVLVIDQQVNQINLQPIKQLLDSLDRHRQSLLSLIFYCATNDDEEPYYLLPRIVQLIGQCTRLQELATYIDPADYLGSCNVSKSLTRLPVGGNNLSAILPRIIPIMCTPKPSGSFSCQTLV